VRPCVVSHLNCKSDTIPNGRKFTFQEKSRNFYMIAGLLIKCNQVR
jgi:hypothetical protein